MIELRQIRLVFYKDIIENPLCHGGGADKRMNGKRLQGAVIIAGYGGFNGKLLVGLHILQQTTDF